MTGSTDRVPWEAVDEIVETGGFASMSSAEASALIAGAIERPELGGAPVAKESFDAQEAERYLVGAYVDATAPALIASALDYADSIRASADEDVVPALCRAAGVGPEAYEMACAERDAGNRSPMLDMYSAFLGSL